MANPVRFLGTDLQNNAGQSAFAAGSGSTVFGPIPAEADMDPSVLYIDNDCKEQGWLDTSGTRCVVYVGEGQRIVQENFDGVFLAEDGSGAVLRF